MPAWPLPPLFSADWKDLSAGESIAVIARYSAAQAAAGAEPTALRAIARRCRAVPLAFYPRWLCVEVEWHAGAGTATETVLNAFLYGPGARLALLGFTPQVLYQFNPTELIALDAARTGPDYLRFFLSQVARDDARVILIEDVAALPGDPDRHAHAPWVAKIHPLAMTSAAGRLVGNVTVLLGDQLVRSDFAIENGMVNMVGDEKLADIARAPEYVRHPFRVVGLPKPVST